MPRGGDTQRQVSSCYGSHNMQWDETQCQTLNSIPQAPEDQYWWLCFETRLSLAGSERSLSTALGQQLVCLLLTSSAFSLSKLYCDSSLRGPVSGSSYLALLWSPAPPSFSCTHHWLLPSDELQKDLSFIQSRSRENVGAVWGFISCSAGKEPGQAQQLFLMERKPLAGFYLASLL